ncbi:MAG: tRNA pseudouridine(55) synthase TruB [Phycisphaerales bacterium]
MPRRPKNHRPDLNALLVVDKPVGPTSMDVCRVVRRLTGGAKVGHAGTLDPLASGVLILCLGSATKSIDALMATEKRYRAAVDLAAFSATDDLEGAREPVAVETPPTLEEIERACRAFEGVIQQRPPTHSAVHVDGQRAYRLARDAAREGGVVERPPARPVTIHAVRVVAYAWPALELDIRCGKGTYIRSLARDLGEALGTGGMLTALRRTAVGEYTADEATPLDRLPDRIEPHDLRPAPGSISQPVEHEHAPGGSPHAG